MKDIFVAKGFGKSWSYLLLFSGIPAYKKGDQRKCNNYKPISLLSNISQLIEKLLYNRLYKFLNRNKYLFNYQFGFRSHHYTNQALISITEKIRKALGEGQFACGVFLDCQKAFDTANHKILISGLEHYGSEVCHFIFFKIIWKNEPNLLK